MYSLEAGLELEPGMDMLNKREHTRILEWFGSSERNTLRPLFVYCFGE
jgi:hypothetical protein